MFLQALKLEQCLTFFVFVFTGVGVGAVFDIFVFVFAGVGVGAVFDIFDSGDR